MFFARLSPLSAACARLTLWHSLFHGLGVGATGADLLLPRNSADATSVIESLNQYASESSVLVSMRQASATPDGVAQQAFLSAWAMRGIRQSSCDMPKTASSSQSGSVRSTVGAG